MNKKIINFGLSFFIVMSLSLSLVGCGQDKVGGTISEPKITVEYLEEDYSEQLINDGAKTTIGMVSISKNASGEYKVLLHEREIVKSKEHEEGYYIADNNIEKDLYLGMDARLVVKNEDELKISNPDEFINVGENNEQLYEVYIMGESVEMILPVEAKDMAKKYN